MLTLLTVADLNVVEMDPRDLILSRLKELDKSHYWLAQQVKGEISENAVYSYLRGESDMKGKNLGKVFKALDLELSPKRKK